MPEGDQQMVRFKGASPDTTKAPNKPRHAWCDALRTSLPSKLQSLMPSRTLKPKSFYVYRNDSHIEHFVVDPVDSTKKIGRVWKKQVPNAPPVRTNWKLSANVNQELLELFAPYYGGYVTVLEYRGGVVQKIRYQYQVDPQSPHTEGLTNTAQAYRVRVKYRPIPLPAAPFRPGNLVARERLLFSGVVIPD